MSYSLYMINYSINISETGLIMFAYLYSFLFFYHGLPSNHLISENCVNLALQTGTISVCVEAALCTPPTIGTAREYLTF